MARARAAMKPTIVGPFAVEVGQTAGVDGAVTDGT